MRAQVTELQREAPEEEDEAEVRPAMVSLSQLRLLLSAVEALVPGATPQIAPPSRRKQSSTPPPPFCLAAHVRHAPAAVRVKRERVE